MKLNSDQIQQAYDRLLADPSLSIRKLARELKVAESSLRERLKKIPSYDRLNPPQGSLAKVLKQEIIPSLSSDQKVEVTKWMNQHYELLTKDSGLLTASQENRLTWNECPHSHDLDHLLTFSEFLNDRLNSQTEYEIVPLDFGTGIGSIKEVNHPKFNNAPLLPSSYINLIDLEELLDDYFSSTLDEVPPKLIDRLYLPIHLLHSDNSLWGQCTSEMIELCLAQLPLQESAALKFYFIPSIELEALLLTSFYNCAPLKNFPSFIQDQYFTALDHLSDHLLQLLN